MHSQCASVAFFTCHCFGRLPPHHDVGKLIRQLVVALSRICVSQHSAEFPPNGEEFHSVTREALPLQERRRKKILQLPTLFSLTAVGFSPWTIFRTPPQRTQSLLILIGLPCRRDRPPVRLVVGLTYTTLSALATYLTYVRQPSSILLLNLQWRSSVSSATKVRKNIIIITTFT